MVFKTAIGRALGRGLYIKVSKPAALFEIHRRDIAVQICAIRLRESPNQFTLQFAGSHDCHPDFSRITSFKPVHPLLWLDSNSRLIFSEEVLAYRSSKEYHTRERPNKVAQNTYGGFTATVLKHADTAQMLDNQNARVYISVCKLCFEVHEALAGMAINW